MRFCKTCQDPLPENSPYTRCEKCLKSGLSYAGREGALRCSCGLAQSPLWKTCFGCGKVRRRFQY